MELPLSVAIAALIQDRKILLIKRIKGSYTGLWSLPGGKIEKSEHVSEAAVREILEETGIRSKFQKHLGFVSEHLREDNKVVQHFLLHLCQLQAEDNTIIPGREGELCWFPLALLEQYRPEIIPSDYLMIKKMVLAQEGNYFNCVIERSGQEHYLEKFE